MELLRQLNALRPHTTRTEMKAQLCADGGALAGRLAEKLQQLGADAARRDIKLAHGVMQNAVNLSLLKEGKVGLADAGFLTGAVMATMTAYPHEAVVMHDAAIALKNSLLAPEVARAVPAELVNVLVDVTLLWAPHDAAVPFHPYVYLNESIDILQRLPDKEAMLVAAFVRGLTTAAFASGSVLAACDFLCNHSSAPHHAAAIGVSGIRAVLDVLEAFPPTFAGVGHGLGTIGNVLISTSVLDALPVPVFNDLLAMVRRVLTDGDRANVFAMLVTVKIPHHLACRPALRRPIAERGFPELALKAAMETGFDKAGDTIVTQVMHLLRWVAADPRNRPTVSTEIVSFLMRTMAGSLPFCTEGVQSLAGQAVTAYTNGCEAALKKFAEVGEAEEGEEGEEDDDDDDDA